MKLLLLYPPFCTPTIVSYSISYLKSFLLANGFSETSCLDLNALFHKKAFSKYYTQIGKESFANLFTRFHADSKDIYSTINKQVVSGSLPVYGDVLFAAIKRERPTHIAFSIVYSSQVFYASALIDMITAKLGIPVIVGGPAVSELLKKKAIYLSNEYSLVDYLGKRASIAFYPPDYSSYCPSDYLSEKIVYPVKSSSGCYHGQCTFCTHPQLNLYHEHPLVFPRGDYFCFIDSMISTGRLLKIGDEMKKKNAKWWVQLRPTRDLLSHLDRLASCGMRSVAWGVESGSQEIIKRMKKGTLSNDIEQVLKKAKEAGIINTVFIMFGFPGETKEDFIQTIEFLKRNADYIDLVSTSIFGLQKGSDIYLNPEKYGVHNIQDKKRTLLDASLSFRVSNGLSTHDAAALRKRFKKTIEKINKIPKIYNYVKEQTLLL
jgi:hypothetical protein